MNHRDRTGTIAPSWFRLQWKKLLAVLDDHPLPTLVVVCAGILLVAFYVTQLHGLTHFRESFARWRVEVFGGVHEVDRAVRMPDVLLSFKPRGYDRLDVLSMTSIHFGGQAFRDELRRLAGRGGIIRVVILDPRLSDPGAPSQPAFRELARAFGKSDWELTAQCWFSTAVVLNLSKALGDSLQVRLISQPLAAADAPYFAPGRSSHAYLSTDPEDRSDVIVPRPDPEKKLGSLSHPAAVIIDRIDHPQVQRFRSAFEEAWAQGTVVDESLYQEFANRIYATETR